MTTWKQQFEDAAEGFVAFVGTLDPDQRDEALRRGGNTLDRLTVELAAERRGLTGDDLRREALAGVRPMAGCGAVEGAG